MTNIENAAAPNECIAPPALSDDQLALYLDGQAETEVVAHVRRCAFCRARAQAQARWQTRLQSRLFRSECPTADQLGEYQLGLLQGARAMVMAKHIAECPHCAGETVQLRDFLDDQRPATATAPAAEPMGNLLGGLIGVLTGQVRSRSTSRAGIRGNAREPLTIDAGDVQIILDMQPAPDGKATLLGQLASEQFEQWVGAHVELWQSGEPQRSTTIDDIGTFQLTDMLFQPAELLIAALDGRAIRVANIDLTTE